MQSNDIRANAQAGAVNISANDVTFQSSLNFGVSGSSNQASFPARFIRGIREAISPADVARTDAELRQLEAESVSKSIAAYRQAFPSFSDAQLFLLAYGYSTSAAEADNVLKVLERAGQLLDGNQVNELPFSSIDLDICGAKSSYDDELKEIWAKLISQEVSTGESRSKRTKTLLREMDAEDANQLLSVLRCCVWTTVGPKSIYMPIPVLLKTPTDDSWTYNAGTVSNDAITTLDSLGILTSSEWISFTIKPNGYSEMTSLPYRIIFNNKSNEEIKFDLGNAEFLKPGIELAKIINAPINENILQIMSDILEVEVSWEINE